MSKRINTKPAPYAVGDRVSFDNPVFRVEPFLGDDVMVVYAVMNTGSERRPHWRLKCVSITGGREGWLDAASVQVST